MVTMIYVSPGSLVRFTFCISLDSVVLFFLFEHLGNIRGDNRTHGEERYHLPGTREGHLNKSPTYWHQTKQPSVGDGSQAAFVI